MTESNNRQDSVRHYIKRDTAQARGYSQAVVTKGGGIVWLAGQVGAADASGKSLAGDFDGQVREVFSRLGQTLERTGQRHASRQRLFQYAGDRAFDKSGDSQAGR